MSLENTTDSVTPDPQAELEAAGPIAPAPAVDADLEAQNELPAGPPIEPPRGAIAEWAITIILLLFLTTTLVQAYVIPTGSMEDTLLIGDHLLVDKMAFAPTGVVSKHLLLPEITSKRNLCPTRVLEVKDKKRISWPVT